VSAAAEARWPGEEGEARGGLSGGGIAATYGRSGGGRGRDKVEAGFFPGRITKANRKSCIYSVG
jgi:hypothetical protein